MERVIRLEGVDIYELKVRGSELVQRLLDEGCSDLRYFSISHIGSQPGYVGSLKVRPQDEELVQGEIRKVLSGRHGDDVDKVIG